MKKLLVTIITAALFLIPLNAIAAVKAGATCSKAGSTSTAAGKKYTCIKSGKKLVWNKGEAISKPVPSISPTPSPSQTPTPTPVPTATPTPSSTLDRNKGTLRSLKFVYRFNNGVLERKIAGSSEYTSIDTRQENSFDLIRINAFNEIRNYKSIPLHPNIEVIYTIKDSFPKENAEAIKSAVELTASYLSAIFTENSKIAVTLVTEKDVDFINQSLGSLSRPDQVQITLKSVARYTGNTGSMGSGSAGFNRKRDGFNGGFYLGTSASYSNINFYWPEVPSHELAHVLQMYFISQVNFLPNEQYTNRVKSNFLEGSANTLGHAWAVPNLGWFSDEMDYTLKSYLLNQGFSKKLNSEAEVVELLEKTESFDEGAYFELSYVVGQEFWEYAIGKYGFGKYLTFLKNISVTNNYEDNFLKTYGVSKMDLYRESASYILSVWNRAITLPDQQ